MQLIKLTDQDMRTCNGFQWELRVWKEAPGTGELCSAGWLHACEHGPELAIALNPIVVGIKHPRVFRAVGSGRVLRDGQLKIGVQRLQLVEELPAPVIGAEALVRWAILCAREACRDGAFLAWSDAWLSGEDRSLEATVSVAAMTVWEATAAAWAAEAWAATAAAWAAEALVRPAQADAPAETALFAARAAALVAESKHAVNLAALLARAIKEESAYQAKKGDGK